MRVKNMVVFKVAAENRLAVRRGRDAAALHPQLGNQAAFVTRIGNAQRPAVLRIGLAQRRPFASVDQRVFNASGLQLAAHQISRITLRNAVEGDSHARLRETDAARRHLQRLPIHPAACLQHRLAGR